VNPPTKSKRVLIVDDNPAFRAVLTRTLQQAGHEVGTAVDGEDGLKKFREREWDLVLTDQQMPRMGGERMAAAIVAEAPGTPVILVTGSVAVVHNPRAFYASIGKPFRGLEIVELVNSAPPRV
jgi:CheY-like chemotaxis protein